MRYTLTEIRQMTSDDIRSKLDEANTYTVRYAAMNPKASEFHLKNALRFEQVLEERSEPLHLETR